MSFFATYHSFFIYFRIISPFILSQRAQIKIVETSNLLLSQNSILLQFTKHFSLKISLSRINFWQGQGYHGEYIKINIEDVKKVNYQLYITWRAFIIKTKQSANMHKFFSNLPMKKPVESNNMDIENPESQNVPWVEKYRPSSLDELSYQYEVTSALKNIVKTGNIPHLLFYGPAGTGKTSAVIAMAKQIFGLGFYKQRIIELNASDQRGINVIRQKVKTFAQKIHKKNPDASSNSPKTKIIILDEADLLTNDAQSALRRIIEDYSSNTRFCIICNYITKIIEPLASRCIKFRFKPIPTQVQFAKLTEICNKENINLNRKDLQLLVEKGDLRQSINSLQSLSKISTVSEYILPVSSEFCENIFQKIINSSNMKQVYQLAEEIGCEGYAIDEIINGLFNTVLKLPEEKTKAILLEALAKAGEGLEQGASQLPLVDLFTTFFYVLNLSI